MFTEYQIRFFFLASNPDLQHCYAKKKCPLPVLLQGLGEYVGSPDQRQEPLVGGYL